MASPGFLIIPGAIIADMSIFCDTGFIILSGLAKAFSARTKAAMPLIAGALGCSLSSVHCLIPAHPGALAAAGILDDNIYRQACDPGNCFCSSRIFCFLFLGKTDD